MKIFDAHGHIASWQSIEESEKALLYGMEQHGIGGCLISNADCATFPSERRIDYPSLSAEAGLKAAIDFARKYPGKIYVAAWITPRREKVPSQELIDLIEDNRDIVKSLKLHPFCERMAPNDERMEPYYDLARKLDLPFLVHTAMDPDSAIGNIVDAAKAHPDIRFVAAHLELMSNHLYAIEVLREVPNVYCDTAWVEMPVAVRAMNELGPDRVFFGTDAPVDGEETLDHPYYRAYFENTERLGEEDYARLMAQNALNFYRIRE